MASDSTKQALIEKATQARDLLQQKLDTSKAGIVTSDDASSRAKSANETLDGLTVDAPEGDSSPFSSLYDNLKELQDKLAQSQAAEAAAKQKQEDQDMQIKLKTMDSASEVATKGNTDLNAANDAINGGGDTSGIEDPMMKMYTDNFLSQTGIIKNQMDTLEGYRAQFNEYTQQDIDSIARTAARSVERQQVENERTKRAMEFAGVLGGRAQYSPIVQESIIADVVQEGLDAIEVINEKKNTAIREARKAEADFNIDLFEQQANLAKEYNDQVQATFSAMNTRVRQVEQDERERVEFRQEQEERNSLILAQELTDATPEQIMQAAAANGIDPGLLTKAVNDAKYEQQSNELDIAGKKENIRASQESTKISWANYALNKAKFDATQTGGGETDEPMTVSEIKQFSERNGWTPPQGMTLATAQAIHGGLRVLPEDVRAEYATLMTTNPDGADQYLSEQLTKVAGSSIEDKLNAEGSEEVKKLYEQAANEMGVNSMFTFGDFKNVAKTGEFKEAYTQVFQDRMTAVADPTSDVNTFATDAEFLKAVLDKTLELNTGKNKKLQELADVVNTDTNRNANSTPAINF